MFDLFGLMPYPFQIRGRESSNTVIGGLMSIWILSVGALFLFDQMNKMIFFVDAEVSQITIHGTQSELTTVYGQDQLGNTSFAIQVK